MCFTKERCFLNQSNDLRMLNECLKQPRHNLCAGAPSLAKQTPFKPQMINVEQSSVICRFNFVIYCGYLLLVKLRP